MLVSNTIHVHDEECPSCQHDPSWSMKINRTKQKNITFPIKSSASTYFVISHTSNLYILDVSHQSSLNL